jgi:hypothetical protein
MIFIVPGEYHNTNSKICTVLNRSPSLLAFIKVTPTTHNITIDAQHSATLQEAYVKYAGIPRICFSYFSEEVRKIRFNEVEKALDNIPWMAIKGLFPFRQDISRMIIKINPVDDSFVTPFRKLISDYIAELLFERMKTVNDAKLSETIFEKIRCSTQDFLEYYSKRQSTPHFNAVMTWCPLALPWMPRF